MKLMTMIGAAVKPVVYLAAQAMALASPLHIKSPKRLQRRILCKSRRHEDLFAELCDLKDSHLAAWMADNRDTVTLDFLSWVADLEERASNVEERQRLWALGSKLMTLREGFDVVSMETVDEQLREAALSASSSSSQQESTSNAPALRGLTSVVQQTAALGLSAEGMSLLQQQAAALEATVGITRAQSLTEVIGRKAVSTSFEAQGVMDSDAAGRILEVLLTMHSRQDRAAALPDAFSPPDDDPTASDNDFEYDPDEEELYTSPMQLLQAVDLMVKRMRQDGDPADMKLLSGRGVAGADVVLSVLKELREDILNYWENVAGEAF